MKTVYFKATKKKIDPLIVAGSYLVTRPLIRHTKNMRILTTIAVLFAKNVAIILTTITVSFA